MFYIGNSGNQSRANHWRDIQSRVKTHEGEVLKGEAGKKYQEKWSKEYLGKDLSQSKQADTKMVEQYQATHEKNK